MNACFCSSGVIPTPVSLITTNACCATTLALTRTCPPGRRVLDRVVEHVAEHALERDGIGGDGNLRALGDELEAQPLAVGEPVRLDERRENAHEIGARAGRGGGRDR